MNNILRNTYLKVYSKANLSQDDIGVLSLMYAPLIGSDAVLLYMIFLSFTKKDLSKRILHKDFYDMIHFTESRFKNSRFKLEGIGLIQSYLNNDEIVYVLYLPQTANMFVNGGVYGMYLNAMIGEDNLDTLLDLFKFNGLDCSKCKNVTKTFDEVFKNSNVTKKKLNQFKLDENLRAESVNLENKKFDYDKFLSLINIGFIGNLNQDDFKKRVSNSAIVFNLDETDMSQAYNQSIGNDGLFSYVLFSRKVEFIYNTKNKDELIPLMETTDFTGKYNEIFESFSNISKEELLGKFNFCNEKNLTVVDKLYEKIPYNRTILNMIIWHALDGKDSFPTYGYFEAIYNSMFKEKIKTTMEAFRYLLDRKKFNKPNRKYYGNDKKDVNPKWAQDAIKEIMEGFDVYDEKD